MDCSDRGHAVVHRIQGCGARMPPTAGSPWVQRLTVRGIADHLRDHLRPDPWQPGVVLGAVKAWPGERVVCGISTATASLDGSCARHWRRHAGRHEETLLGSNQETAKQQKKVRKAETQCLTKSPIQGWAKVGRDFRYMHRPYSAVPTRRVGPRGHGGPAFCAKDVAPPPPLPTPRFLRRTIRRA